MGTSTHRDPQRGQWKLSQYPTDSQFSETVYGKYAWGQRDALNDHLERRGIYGGDLEPQRMMPIQLLSLFWISQPLVCRKEVHRLPLPTQLPAWCVWPPVKKQEGEQGQVGEGEQTGSGRENSCREEEEGWVLGGFGWIPQSDQLSWPRVCAVPSCWPAGRGCGSGLTGHWRGRRVGWGSVWVGPEASFSPVWALGRAGAFCLGLGSSWGQNQLETSLEPEGKGALLAQRTQARRKITYQAALSMLV